eukprot:1315090-Rhodomonas_salina.2
MTTRGKGRPSKRAGARSQYGANPKFGASKSHVIMIYSVLQDCKGQCCEWASFPDICQRVLINAERYTHTCMSTTTGSSSCLAPCPTLFEPRRNQEILAGTVCLVVVMNSPISLQQHVVLLFSHDLWHLEQPQSTARKRNTRFVSVSGALGWVLDEFWSSSAEQREGGSMPGA